MSKKTNIKLEKSLYFTVNSLSRVITKMAEEEFEKLGMVTSHALLLMLTIENKDITQKELADNMNLAQSTISRFVDSLIKKGFLEKKSKGKNVQVFATKKGKEQLPEIKAAWNSLYKRYSKILGKEVGDQITKITHQTYKQLIEKM